MRQYLSKRIFMNEADGGSGNGAQVAPPAPAAPAAAPTAPEPPATSIVDQVANLIDTKLKAFENGFFANARKAGVLKKDEPAPPTSQSPSAAAPAPTGLSMADVEAMLERERVITRVATEHKLSDAQVKRMKGLLTAEKPEDVSGWVSSFVTDMGLARATEPSNPVTPTPQPQPSGHPISDKGSPAPGGVVNWEREFAENPLGMSAAARAAMDAKHGREKAVKMRLDASQQQAARIKVTTTQQG